MSEEKREQVAEAVDCPFRTATDVLAYYQMRLRVPKDQRNDFGKYMYRNMEGINDAFHRVQAELWDEFGILTSLRFSDDVLHVRENGMLERYVVARLTTPFGEVTADMAVREPESQGGMSPSQISGSSSSYAKKYAASDLFAIGGEADPDELPPAAENEYPPGRFNAKCRRCGEVRQGFTAQTATTWPCPSCGATDWEPTGPYDPEGRGK